MESFGPIAPAKSSVSFRGATLGRLSRARAAAYLRGAPPRRPKKRAAEAHGATLCAWSAQDGSRSTLAPDELEGSAFAPSPRFRPSPRPDPRRAAVMVGVAQGRELSLVDSGGSVRGGSPGAGRLVTGRGPSPREGRGPGRGAPRSRGLLVRAGLSEIAELGLVFVDFGTPRAALHRLKGSQRPARSRPRLGASRPLRWPRRRRPRPRAASLAPPRRPSPAPPIPSQPEGTRSSEMGESARAW